MDLDINFYQNYPNQDFLAQHLERWFTRYTPEVAALQMALYKSQIKSLAAQRAFAKLIKPLKSVYDFARPLLNERLHQQFGLNVDCRHVFLEEITATQPYTQGDIQPVLLAALHNFKADKPFHPASALYYRTAPWPPETSGLSTGRLEDVCGSHIACSTGFVNVTPTAFAQMCRALDLGGQYQAHLKNVFTDHPPIKDAFVLKERSRFEVLSHIARMKDDVSEEAYRVLLEVAKTDDKPVWRGGAVHYCAVELFATKQSIGVLLHGMLLIEPHRAKEQPGNDEGPVLVYMPGEPQHPIKEYASVNAFLDYLRVNLLEGHYRDYFGRFIGARDYTDFFAKLNTVLNPGGSFDPGADLALHRERWDSHPFEDLFTHAYIKLMTDAGVLAVPVDARGSRSTPAPLRSLRAIAHLAFDFFDVFLPASEVRDLAREVFIGAENWIEGDTEKALHQLYEIGKDAVLAAAPKIIHEYERLERIYQDGKEAIETLLDELRLATDQPDLPAHATADDEITELEQTSSTDLEQLRNMAKPSAFVEGLAQVKSHDGRTRLWKPDLGAFEQPEPPLKGTRLDGRSLFKADGKTWLSMGGHWYQIAFDSLLSKWRVVNPDGRQTYSPVLEENGAGAWRFEGEDPMGWDARKAFRRLHGDCAALSDSAINHILRITQVDDALLRQIHVDKRVPPALLIDCTQRFLIDKEITGFIDLMHTLSDVEHRGVVKPLVVSTIEPYLDFIVTLPGWPEQRALRRLDEQGYVLTRHASSDRATRTVDVVYAAGDVLGLLKAIVLGLSPVEVESILVNFQPPGSREQYLALRIAAEASGRRKTLFDLIYATLYRSSDRLIQLLQRDFSSLPFGVAKEIISMADSTELQRMSSAARIPLRLAEHAREYLQQLRINRALECFYLHMESPDSDLISLDLINALPVWPQGLVVEVRKNAFDGEKIYRTGGKDTSAAAVNVVLVQTGGRYQTYDSHGRRTWFDSPRLRNTLSSALSRETKLTQNLRELENVLGDMATLQRSRVKRTLGMQPIKPGIKWPSRLPDGRVGYRLSSRVRGLFDRFRNNAPAFSAELAVKHLYPQFTSRQVKAFLQALAASFTGTAQEKKSWVRARLNELGEEYATLENTLDAWVAEAVSPQPENLLGVSSDSRRLARMRILSCWRRDPDSLIDEHSQDSAHQLNLINLNIGSLPLIVANFKHVQAMALENIGLNAEDAGAFIKRFPELRALSLSNNRIESVPQALGDLGSLQSLTLSRNPTRVDLRGMECLQRLSALKTLLLEGENVNIAAVLDVSRWPELVDIRLRDCGLSVVPLGLGVREPLRHVDLRHNQITEVDEPTLSAIAERPRLYVRLHRNPLNVETIASAATLFSEAALIRMGITSVLPAEWTQTPTQWLAETGDALQHQRWRNLQHQPGAEAFLLLVEDLLQTADYRDNRRLLTERLWRMIDAMTGSEALQEELFTLAGHPETCGDGTMITFNMLDVRVLVFQLEALHGDKTPVDLFRLMRGLERLDELERIALEDINARVVSQPNLDQVEVRLMYPTRLRDELALPGQSQGMLFENLSGVNERMLHNAKVRVLARENTPEFFQSLIARKDWLTFLEDHFLDDFETVRQPFHDRLDLLDGQKETLTDEAYLSSVNAVYQDLKQAVQAKALQLTTDIAVLASEPT